MQTRYTSTKLTKEGQVLSFELMPLKDKCTYDRIVMPNTKQKCATSIQWIQSISNLCEKSHEKAVTIDFYKNQ